MRAIYAGSFDPITLGHMDIFRQAAQLADDLYISIGQNPKKTRLIDIDESLRLIDELAKPYRVADKTVTVTSFVGMTLAQYATQIGATTIVRGLRQVSDFNDEFVLHGVLDRLAPTIPVTYFICRDEFLHVSSSTARELASFGAPVDWLVSPNVEATLRRIYAKA